MSTTGTDLYDLISRARILSVHDTKCVRERWFKPGRSQADDPEAFARWLLTNRYVTDLVLCLLRAGRADLLHLNEYQILDYMREGIHANSYLAQDSLGRRVVLDVLATERAADPQSSGAFQEMAERAMKVSHPNVSATLDHGLASGLRYLVREYHEGDTLADLLSRRSRLRPLTAARLFTVSVAGLMALQSRGVPGGQLRPQCILLTAAKAGRARMVKLLHTGVPRHWFDFAALAPGMLDGFPRIDIPEPLLPLDPEDDLYKLGTSFYQGLTGQEVPLNGARPPPIARLAPDVPEMLAEIVEQMVAPDPAERQKNGAQVGKRLRIYLASLEAEPELSIEEALATLPTSSTKATVEEPIKPEPEAERADDSSADCDEESHAQSVTGWQELKPSDRDLMFLLAGAAALVAIVLVVMLSTGMHFVNVVCLLTGMTLSYFLERCLRLRKRGRR